MGTFSGLGGALGGAAFGPVGAIVGAFAEDKFFGGKTLRDTAKSVTGSVLGGALDRFNDNQARGAEWNFYRSHGATIPEIMGSGGVGSGSQTSQGVLGNNFTQMKQQERQQAYDAEQRNLDRAVQVRGQDAQLQAAAMSSGASRYGSELAYLNNQAKLALETRRFENVELPRGLNDIVTSAPEWRRQELLVKMGVDNTMATLLAGKYGIDIMDPSALSRMSQGDWMNLTRDVYGMQSTIFRETAGSAKVVTDGGRSVWDGLKGLLFGPGTVMH